MGTWIFYVILAVILLLQAKPAKRGSWHEDFMSLSVTKGILGICAIFIVLHHMAQALDRNAGALAGLAELGVCFVGLFFFISGYGLYKSLLIKPDYLKGFFRRRLSAVLVPYFIVNLVFLLFCLAMGDRYTPGELVAHLTGWKMLNTHMWYVIEIALFYILFYVIFRFVKIRWAALLIMGASVTGFVLWSLLLGHGERWFQGEWWFNTSLLFVAGMVFAANEERICRGIKRFYLPVIIFAAIATMVFYKLTAYMLEHYSYYSEYAYRDGRICAADKLRCLSVQLPFAFFFTVLVLLITMKLQFRNRLLDCLGKIALELYLIHNLFIGLFRNPKIVVIKNNTLYVFAVLAASIAAAIILHIADRLLIKAIKGKK